ncbi:MAG: prepilin peptidase [Planctomycetota bacterium]|jgi:leader peptidase (prepilin peptidase)/N-methyltransferase
MPTDPDPTLYVAFWAVFGAIVGSFLNVAIYRLPRPDLTVSKPARSQCPSCGHGIRWYENLPIVSWVALRGRCAACGWRIPVRYPLVEAITSGLFAWSAWTFGPLDPVMTGIAALVWAGLVVATFVDFDFWEIPDEVSIGGMVLGPILSVLVPRLHDSTELARHFAGPGGQVDSVAAGIASIAGLAVGGGVLLGIGVVGKWVYRKDAMGLGDVKLLAAGGAFIGPGGALVALMIASVIGSIVGILSMLGWLLLLRRRVRRRGARRSFASSVRTARRVGNYLPFGPYLGMGVGIVLLAWNHVLSLLP